MVLVRFEGEGLLSQVDHLGYSVFKAILDCCRSLVEHGIASHAGAAMERLGLIALAPIATSTVGVADERDQCASVAKSGQLDERNIFRRRTFFSTGKTF